MVCIGEKCCYHLAMKQSDLGPSPMAIVAAGMTIALAACRGRPAPPVAEMQADLARNAAVVCAPPPRRPPHTRGTRVVTVLEIERALGDVCSAMKAPPGGAECGFSSAELPACQARSAAARSAIAVIHEGLAGETATVGTLRRSRLLFEAPQLEMTSRSESRPGSTVADAIAAMGAARACPADSLAVPAAVVTLAVGESTSGRPDEGLESCADAFALARDALLTGTLIDALTAAVTLEQASKRCGPVVDRASTASVTAFAESLSAMRSSLPHFDEIADRDLADVMLVRFGAGYGSPPPPCERATRLAKTLGGGAQLDDVAYAWASRGPRPTVTPGLLERHAVVARTFQSLIERARARVADAATSPPATPGNAQ